MKGLKKITKIINAMFTIALLVFFVFMRLDAEKTSKFIGYQFYTVLTDSMEPVIPTFSFVLSELVDENTELQPGDIVTFHADRFGVDTVFTHYLKEIEQVDGETYYRTQGANAPDHYDNYDTTRDDIVGVYRFHIPYLGRIALFLQSEYGLLMMGEILIIWLINVTIRTRWDEENIGFAISDVIIGDCNGCFTISGKIQNLFRKPVRYIKGEVYLYDEDHNLIRKEPWYVRGNQYLASNEQCSFTFITAQQDEKIAHFDIFIRKYQY